MTESNYKLQSEAKLAATFTAFLLDKGFPDSSLIYEPLLKGSDGRLYRPDFLIVDPIRNERIAIIEVKGRVPENYRALQSQVEKYKQVLGEPNLPVFLVVPSVNDSKYPFDVYALNSENKLQKFDLGLFPVFSALSSNQLAEKKQDLKQEEKEVVDSFKRISYITVSVLVVLLIADFICSLNNITLLTVERLTLLGGAVALVVIPFAQKFKGLGIEWERIQDNSKSD